MIESRVEELQEKPALEEAEAAELRELETVLDNGNYSDFLRMVNRETIREMLFEAKKSAQQPQENKTNTANRTDTANTAAAQQAEVSAEPPEPPVQNGTIQTSEAAEEGEAEASARAERELKLRRELPHNPADTAAEIEKWQKLFPNANIQTTDAWTPEQIRILRRRGVLAPEKAQGMFDIKTNTVILNVSNLRPSEVGFKILHEVGLHLGIRQAFGDEAANRLFLAVFDAVEDSPFMQRIIDAYKLRTPMLDENGEAIYNPDGTPLFDDMTDAQKAEAAEEFLAFAAETYGVPIDEIYADNRAEIDRWGREHGRDTHDWNEKRRMTREWMAETGFKPERPGWWKQLISQIRVWLAQHGFGHLREADIETIIQDAFRGANRTNRTNRTNGEIRYSVDESLKAVFQAEEDADIRQAYPQKSGYSLKQMKDTILPQLSGKTYVNRDTGKTAQINSAQRKELVSPKAVSRTIANGTVDGVETLFAQDHLDAVANIDALYENAVLLQTRGDLKNGKEGITVSKFAAPFVVRGEVYDAILTQKESEDKESSARVYFLELDELVKNDGGARPDHTSPSRVTRLTRENSSPSGWNKLQQKREKVKRFLEKNQKKSDGARFSVSPVWTGSAANYDQPDMNYVGTGEGAQEYGYGLYGSSSRGVGEGYAEADVERKNAEAYSLSNSLTIKGKRLRDDQTLRDFVSSVYPEDKLKQCVAITISSSMRDASSFEDLVEIAKENGGYYMKSNGYSKEEWDAACEEVGEDIELTERKRNLYRQTFWPDKKENLLDWDEDLPDEQRDKIFAELEKDSPYKYIGEDQQYGKVFEHKLTKKHLLEMDFQNATGKDAYKILTKALGSKKAASEFLYRAGIDGVTYIGDTSGVRNYVAFNDADIRVDEHIRFSVSPVWTGSAADYDQPSLFYVGTGEGAQVYGYGLYGSSSRGVGTGYAEADVKRKTRPRTMKFRGQEIVSPETAGFVGEMEFYGNKDPENQWKRSALNRIYMGVYQFPEDDLPQIAARIKENPLTSGGGFTQEMWERAVDEIARDVELVPGEVPMRNLYKQTFWPDKEENLLDWDEKIPQEQVDAIQAQAEEEGIDVSFLDEKEEVIEGEVKLVEIQGNRDGNVYYLEFWGDKQFDLGIDYDGNIVDTVSSAFGLDAKNLYELFGERNAKRILEFARQGEYNVSKGLFADPGWRNPEIRESVRFGKEVGTAGQKKVFRI